ncbi:MAG: hypothetical protein MZV63_56645 [Marinilabiliales bacterium]|nr:hypothetical protein [Marinilabiliales bacterium]
MRVGRGRRLRRRGSSRGHARRRWPIVPAGYADGLDTRLGGRGHVLVRGRRAPIVGAVSMDMLTVDVTGLPVRARRRGRDHRAPGRRARSRWARWPGAIGTIPYEILRSAASSGSMMGWTTRDLPQAPAPVIAQDAQRLKPPKTVFVCQECGSQSPKWLGRCPDCGAWNSLVEERAPEAAPRRRRSPLRRRPAARARSSTPTSSAPTPPRIADRHRRVRPRARRRHRARLAGAARRRARHRQVHAAAAGRAPASPAPPGPCSTVSGEESEHQVKSRGERLGVGDAPLYLLAETCLERDPRGGRPGSSPPLLVVDSIQTVFSLEAAVGARQHRPGARGRDAAALRGEGRRTSRRSSSATSRRTAASPAPSPSSTSSTPCSTSRAKRQHPTASSARRRTGSAPCRELGRLRDDRRPA